MFPHLDERQRRLLAGAEARALGHGGIRAVARAAGIREATVARGASGAGRWRRAVGPGPAARRGPQAVARAGSGSAAGAAGAGRARGTGRSDVAAAVDDEVDPDAGRGADPPRASGSAPTPSATCCARRASACRATPRRIEGKQHPDRDAQFRYLNEQVQTHTRTPGSRWSAWTPRRRNWSASSTTAGREWRPAGEPGAGGRSTTSPTAPAGQGRPVRDLRPDREHRLGQRRHRPRHRRVRRGVAAPLVARRRARPTYPDATRLLITADAGGSNSYRIPGLEGRAGRARRRDRPGRSPSATSRPAPRSGTRSSTGCSATSP